MSKSSDVVEIALAEVGYKEKASNPNLDLATANTGTNNIVKKNTYARTSSYIAGYGHPNYTETDEATATVPASTSTTTNTEGKAVTISTYTLQKGSTGSRVRKLQILLNGLGHDCGEVDGDFGTKTLAAVKAFQSAQKITADGIVGAVTWTKLIN